jgi:AraC-like DNA-binding protein
MNTETEYAINPGWRLVMSDAGINVNNVLRRAGLPRDLFTSGAKTLTTNQYYALWEGLVEEAQQPDLPLLIGGAISLETFDPPLFAATCSPNLNVAARRIAQHKKLIGPLRLLVTADTETELEMAWPVDSPPPIALSTMELVFWVALVRMTTRHHVRPVRVTTPHPPEDSDSYRDYLGVGIQRGPRYTVVFSAEDATRPFVTANERMWEYFEPELRKRLSEMDTGTTVSERVRASLLELLPAGSGSMEAVASELMMSTRTLQRRLKNEGTSFQTVLNETRESLARHYLANSELPATEISFLLGYEDPRSFYRAVHAWTGLTPLLLRTAG